MKTKVTCLQCPRCGDVIYSRARHDCHDCSCGSLMIDGGFDYIKFGWRTTVPKPSPFQIFIPNIDRKGLYQDWDTGTHLYGTIPGADFRQGRRVRTNANI